MSSPAIICANRDCNIAVDGKCIEGLETKTCPNFGRAPSEEESSPENATPPPPTFHNLSPSAVLDPVAASRLLAARVSRVVAVIATHDAGKTSLIAAIYDAFQGGPVAGMAFAGSSTLHSFELACHDSRSASRRHEASIFRTPRGDARFYHIDLRPDEGEVLTLLIADRAGEEYLVVSHEAVNAEPLFEVRRADTLVILVDGARLADVKERHNVRAELEGIVQGLQDGDVLNGRQRLAIVLTKNDEVMASQRAAGAQADFGRLVDSIRKTFGASFAEIESVETAASPKAANANRGQGLPKLLTFWLKAPIVPQITPPKLQLVRDFERLKEAGA